MSHTFVTIVIPTSRVLTLNSNPVQLVPGSSGNLLTLNSLYIRYVKGSAIFNPAANDVIVAFTGDGTAAGSLLTYPGAVFLATGFVDQTQDMSGYLDGWLGQIAIANTSDSPAARPASIIVGAGLYLTQFSHNPDFRNFPSGTDWTQGNGSLIVRVEYSYLLA